MIFPPVTSRFSVAVYYSTTFNEDMVQYGITTEMMLTYLVYVLLFFVVIKFTVQCTSFFCRNSQMLISATFFIPGVKLKTLFCSSALRIVFYCSFCCLFCLSVQLCGETFGPAWQFSEALARRDIDKNVNIGKRIHEGQGKGKNC